MDLLTLPVLGAPRLVHWLAGKVAEEAEKEVFDEGRLREQLLELQQRLEVGEITEEEYDQQEEAMLERLRFIREYKEGRH